MIKALPAGESERPAGVGYELIKLAWLIPKLKSRIEQLMQYALDYGELPVEFDFTEVVPGFKEEGDSADTQGYRYFMMIDIVCRVLGRLVAARLAECMLAWVRESCMGFIAGFSIDDVVGILRRMQEDLGFAAKVLFGALQLDFYKAFDSLLHGAIAHALRAWGFVGKLGRLTLRLLTVIFTVVGVKGSPNSRFGLQRRGIKTGDQSPQCCS